MHAKLLLFLQPRTNISQLGLCWACEGSKHRYTTASPVQCSRKPSAAHFFFWNYCRITTIFIPGKRAQSEIGGQLSFGEVNRSTQKHWWLLHFNSCQAIVWRLCCKEVRNPYSLSSAKVDDFTDNLFVCTKLHYRPPVCVTNLVKGKQSYTQRNRARFKNGVKTIRVIFIIYFYLLYTIAYYFYHFSPFDELWF